MPKIPGYESKATLGLTGDERPPAVTPQTNQALMNLGQGISDIGRQMVQVLNQGEIQKQYLEGKNAATSEINAFIRSLEEREDYDNFVPDYQKVATGIRDKYTKAFTRPEARGAFDEWYGMHSEGMLMQVWDSTRKKQAFAIQTSAETMYKSAIENNKIEDVAEALKFGRENLIWTEGQAEELRGEAEKQIKYNVTKQLAIDLLKENGVTPESEAMVIDMVYKTEGIEGELQNQLVSDIKYATANYHAMAEQVRKAELEKATNEVLKITNTGAIPSREQIEQISNDESFKSKWFGIIDGEVTRRDEEGDLNDLSRAYWNGDLTKEDIEMARISPEKKDTYRRRFADLEKEKEAELKALTEIDPEDAQLEIENNIVDAYFANKLTHADLLPGGRFEGIREYKGRAEHWRDKIQKRLEDEKAEREKKEKSAWETTNPEVQAEVIRRLVNRDIDYFEYADYLYDVWGQGLSNADYEKYREKSKKEKASSELQSALTIIDGALSNQIKEEYNESRAAELYKIRADLMTTMANEYFDEKYADKDLAARALNLISPYIKKGLFNKYAYEEPPPVQAPRIPEKAKGFSEARGSSEIPPDYVPPGAVKENTEMITAYKAAQTGGKLYQDEATGEYVFQFNGKWYNTTDGKTFEERK
jgi:hypothetical protein